MADQAVVLARAEAAGRAVDNLTVGFLNVTTRRYVAQEFLLGWGEHSTAPALEKISFTSRFAGSRVQFLLLDICSDHRDHEVSLMFLLDHALYLSLFGAAFGTADFGGRRGCDDRFGWLKVSLTGEVLHGWLAAGSRLGKDVVEVRWSVLLVDQHQIALVGQVFQAFGYQDVEIGSVNTARRITTIRMCDAIVLSAAT